MTALLIILGILAGILLVLSIPVVFHIEYFDQLWLQMRWLCFKKQIVPSAKDEDHVSFWQSMLEKLFGGKDKKAEEPEKESTEEEKPQKPNAFAKFYEYQGLKGYLALLHRTANALKKFRHSVWLSVCLRRFHLAVHLPGDDPQALAVRYGKISAAIFPPLGYITARLRSKKGRVRAQITPDFTGKSEREIACAATVSIIPSVLLGAVIMLAIRIFFNVILKFLRGAKAPKDKAKGETA